VPIDLTVPQSGGASFNLTVNLGEILFVLGPNGAGKSTLMHGSILPIKTRRAGYPHIARLGSLPMQLPYHLNKSELPRVIFDIVMPA
jgi:ABC-type glutathione transport system ATPase component